ncbi:sugar/nucleoside kinase (ribokinase family) [Psychromicrobium silvestre]|uniref:Sugar/nucleoside kinase (Ribokinase family) n=1 Tax=Psychromicrobium silvestre TaxID=1645614 RepID=A0A7Y9LUT0_9MICC|nr:PfkB family carbohydrate kinase [Psychromicrobium silvestre]NYE95969.1 sugar/nucleoside kinase (ribokinase family) [Psychromicrobium silvestre]
MTSVRSFDRLVSLGNVLVDIVVAVGELPERGSDVIAKRAGLAVGGGFNLMASAARQGLPVFYGGLVGSGPFGDIVRGALNAEGIEFLDREDAVDLGDTGFDVALIEADGERTFVTASGAEACWTRAHADRLMIGARDALAVSGYSLLQAANQEAVLRVLHAAPAEAKLFYDPGPLGHKLPSEVLSQLYRRVDWWSCNESEAYLSTGAGEPFGAAEELLGRLEGGSVVIRLGAEGCVLALPGKPPRSVPVIPVEPIDSNGAGDAHLGAFIAALARGLEPFEAASWANHAAAISVRRVGPAVSPDASATQTFLDSGVLPEVD